MRLTGTRHCRRTNLYLVRIGADFTDNPLMWRLDLPESLISELLYHHWPWVFYCKLFLVFSLLLAHCCVNSSMLYTYRCAYTYMQNISPVSMVLYSIIAEGWISLDLIIFYVDSSLCCDVFCLIKQQQFYFLSVNNFLFFTIAAAVVVIPRLLNQKRIYQKVAINMTLWSMLLPPLAAGISDWQSPCLMVKIWMNG